MRAFAIVALLALAPCIHASAAQSSSSDWSPRVVELAGSLAVQDGGRVKPLSTFASFTLLRLSGKRSLATPSGERLPPTAWLLDLLFAPERAAQHEVFLVPDSSVIHALGLRLDDKRKRDRYSFAELEPGLPRLMELAHEYSRIEERERSSVEQQVVHLAENVLAFVRLSRHETLAIVPPAAADEQWTTPAELAQLRDNGTELSPGDAAALEHLQNLAEKRGDPFAFEVELAALHARLVGLARSRGEYAKVELEIRYYRAGLLHWSLTGFGIAFLAAALMWLRPTSRVLRGTTLLAVLAGTLALAAAIAMRCVIRSRPPVSTLYETVLFVTAVGTLIALAVELIDRRRVAISAAAFLGLVGLLIANGYETLDKQDTMPSLVAVLDTNFWLATHVTAITTGYSAGLLAALLASVYLLGKTLRIKRGDADFYRGIARMTYGVLCFGLIFATVGTILGGVWANESWGRFWGWDPKENGALLIVLTQIAILHARLSGWLREHGLCMAAAFGGTVVAFSWWNVNLLGVGLHSYGFTSGIHSALWTYYGIQWSVVGAGGVTWLIARSRGRRAATRALSRTLGAVRKNARDAA